jgi:starch synthase (maltosyl-transferring)
VSRKADAAPSTAELPMKNQGRVQISGVEPHIEGGRYPIKRVIDDVVEVTADIVVDGHNALAAVLLFKEETASEWSELPMEHTINDSWQAQFKVGRIGRWFYTIKAWIDDFASWQRDLQKRVNAAQDVAVELLIGLDLVKKAAENLSDADADSEAFSRCIEAVGDKKNIAEAIRVALSEELADLMRRHPDREYASSYKDALQVIVDPKQAQFSAWYECFPRSCSPFPGEHGTFNDLVARLPYIADMGFDVLYLPPIHPIGETHRKGKNNNPISEPGDVGSPWAIGSKEGGHKAIHPQLGTLADFRKLVAQAKVFGISIALDLAFQCSPDHPYVAEHPEWFRMRPDNTIQYAENPPKKYQDIYPLEFHSPAWRELWEELRSVVMYWVDQGVTIFRVDNPHTKDFSFWEWLIGSVKKEVPEAIFLAEAFTRPKLMSQLAKLGFSQSYTYFAWRNSKWELEDYLTSLTTTELKEYFRPNFWPNTPDILNDYLQVGGPPGFKIRLALAATLSSSYGIYGPPFELCDGLPVALGSEEYMNSEKYQLSSWNLDEPHSLKHYIAQVNKIRRENVVLQSHGNLAFYPVDNESIICYGKHSDDYSEVIIVVVSLDPNWVQSGWLELPIEEFDLPPGKPYQVHDLMDNKRYLWNGSRNFVQLDPNASPAHIFRLRRYQRSERDFDYYF